MSPLYGFCFLAFVDLDIPIEISYSLLWTFSQPKYLSLLANHVVECPVQLVSAIRGRWLEIAALCSASPNISLAQFFADFETLGVVFCSRSGYHSLWHDSTLSSILNPRGRVLPENESLFSSRNLIGICGDTQSLLTLKKVIALVSSRPSFRLIGERSQSPDLDHSFNWLMDPGPLQSFVSIILRPNLSPRVRDYNASRIYSVCLVLDSSILFFVESCFGQFIFGKEFLTVSKRKSKENMFNLGYDIGEGFLAMSTDKAAMLQVWSNFCEGFLAILRTKAADLQLLCNISLVQAFSAYVIYVIENFFCFMKKLAMLSYRWMRPFALFFYVQERIVPPQWLILCGRFFPCEIPGTHTNIFITASACGFNRPEVRIGSVLMMILGEKDWSSTSRKVTRLLQCLSRRIRTRV